MARNSKAMTSKTGALSRASSRDSGQANSYYHDVLRDAVNTVKSAEAQRRTANESGR